MKLSSKQIGVTLLELILVLAIVALVILMAARYYKSAQEEMKITKTVEAIHKITEASFEWVKGTGNFADFSPHKTLIDALIAEKYLTIDDFVNPWGGSIGLTASTNTQCIDITISGMPGTSEQGICFDKIKPLLEKQDFKVNCGANSTFTYPKSICP